MRHERPPQALSPTIVVEILCVSLAGLALHVRYYFPYLADDALISLRYAQRLLDGHGLTWTDGPRVEGYSNLLWTLLVAFLGALGIDLVAAVRVLGAAATAGVNAALCFGFATKTTFRSVFVTAVVCAFWVLYGPTAIWTFGGLEQPLVACLLSWTLAIALRPAPSSPRWRFGLGGLLAAVCLARIDGVLFAAIFIVWVAVRGGVRRPAWRQAIEVAAVPAILVVAQFLFRRAYYGEWWPNVAYCKLNPSGTHALSGLTYVGKGVAAMSPVGELSLLALALLWLEPRTRTAAALLATLVLSWLAYLVVIGGDFYPAWRHLLPVMAVLLVALLLAFTAELPRWRPRVVIPIALVAIGWFTVVQFHNKSNRFTKQDLWVWNGEVVGRALKRGFAGRDPVLAVTAAGTVPYWSGLPCLDLLGLNDHHIARTRPQGWGQGRVAHEVGDSEYVMARRPDLMLFATPGGREPCDQYAKDMPQMAVFRENYTICNFEGTDPFSFISRIYVDRESARIGIRRSANEVFVPPYLLNATVTVVTELDTQGRFYITVSPQDPAGILALALEPGRWELVEPSEGVRLRIVESESGALLPEESPSRTVVPAAGRYHVVLEATSPVEVTVHALRLRRW